MEASSRVTVTLSPREGQPLDYTNITVEWIDADGCESRYFVGIYTSSGSAIRDLGYHPAPETTSTSRELNVFWTFSSTFDWLVRVSCAPSDGSGWTIVGEVSLQSGLPSTSEEGE